MIFLCYHYDNVIDDVVDDDEEFKDDKAKSTYGRLELIRQKDVYYGWLRRCAPSMAVLVEVMMMVVMMVVVVMVVIKR